MGRQGVEIELRQSDIDRYLFLFVRQRLIEAGAPEDIKREDVIRTDNNGVICFTWVVPAPVHDIDIVVEVRE